MARYLTLTAVIIMTHLVPAAAGDRIRVSGSVAAGQLGGESYSTVGLGIGVRLFSGMEAGVDGEGWFRSGGTLYRLSPRLQYNFGLAGFRPYVGAFYRRTYVKGPGDDFSSVGGRAGVFRSIGPNVSAGAGVAYERLLDCDEANGATCTSIYPEANVSFSF